MVCKPVRASSRVVVVLAVVGALFAGASAAASTPSAKPQKGGTLVLAKNAEQANGWDPGQMIGVPSNSEVPGSEAIYDVLLYEDPATLKLVPRLAQSLTTSDGGATWTLKLRSGLKFSDGSTLDAEAVQYNWTRLTDPATNPKPLRQPATVAGMIGSMQVVDATTLKLTLKAADPSFNRRVAYNLYAIASPTALKALGANYGTKPIGAGPFVLKEWVRDVQQTYVRNDSYWDKGKPYLDGIVVKFVQDDGQRLNTIQTGGANIGVFFDPTYIAKAEAAGLEAVPMAMYGGGWGMTFNSSKAPFNDVRVRRAISLAIDRKDFVKARRDGDMKFLVNTAERPGSAYYDPKLRLPKSDVAGAQKLIDQVVAEQGGKPVSFTLLTYTTPYIQQDGQYVQAALQKLKGLEVSIESAQPAVIIQRYNAGDYQAVIQGIRWNDPAIDLTSFYMSNGAANTLRYSNPAVDVLGRQVLTATDPAEKIRLEHEIVKIVLNDVPNTWWCTYTSTQALDKTVQDYNLFFDQRPLLDQVWLGNAKKS